MDCISILHTNLVRGNTKKKLMILPFILLVLLLSVAATSAADLNDTVEPPYPRRGQGFPDFNIME